MTTTTPTVAVLGASGTVGRAFIAIARRQGWASRIGVRDPGRLPGDAKTADVRTLDLGDADAVKAFLDGVDVLVNCVGPAYRTRARIARAAADAHVSYVDPTGDDAISARIRAIRTGDTTMLLGTGSVPGAFGLLARLVAARRPGVTSMTGYVVTVEPMHAGTALEFLMALMDSGGAPATWRDGARHDGAAARHGVWLPFAGMRVDANPFLSREMEEVARDLRLQSGEFYHAFESEGIMRTVLADVRGGQAGTGLRAIAASFAERVNADMAGRTPVHVLALQAASPDGVTSAVLRGDSSYAVTAAMTALATRAVLGSPLPPGVHDAGRLPPDLAGQLPTLIGRTTLAVRDVPLDDPSGWSGPATGHEPLISADI